MGLQAHLPRRDRHGWGQQDTRQQGGQVGDAAIRREQLAFWGSKVSWPTESWTDLWQSQHLAWDGLVPAQFAATLPPMKDLKETTTNLGRLATLTRRDYWHAVRETRKNKDYALDPEDIVSLRPGPARLPEIIEHPEDVLADDRDKKIRLFVFTPANRQGKKGKVVVRPQFRGKLHLGLHPKNKFVSHSVCSGGYVDPNNLLEGRYKSVL